MALYDQVQQARKAGFSDDDIAQELLHQRGLASRYQEATKAGFSATDILDELAPKPSGFFEGTAASTLARGAEAEADILQQTEDLRRGMDIGSGHHDPDDSLSQGILGA